MCYVGEKKKDSKIVVASSHSRHLSWEQISHFDDKSRRKHMREFPSVKEIQLQSN